jgi:hypothetical protein
MSQLWASAFQSAGLHLSAGWFWLFPLLFLIHDGEEATYVWMKGSPHNSISSTTLNLPQMLVAISFEPTYLMAAAAWAAEPRLLDHGPPRPTCAEGRRDSTRVRDCRFLDVPVSAVWYDGPTSAWPISMV